ncbi:MAG: class I SAM-dependent methyltransferase [Mycobacteriales bacterium]
MRDSHLDQQHKSSSHEHAAVEPSEIDWDERYGGDQLWSGAPNGSLVAEMSGVASPGRALDVGCGEGADAVWLSQQGWDVTALDVSRVALDRAAAAAEEAGVTVEWLHSGLLEAALEPGSFDLVTAHYPVLRRTPEEDAIRMLMDLVAPGGTLLFVHHADIDKVQAAEHGFDPEDYVQPRDVAAHLGSDWRVVVNERRSRHVERGGGAHHDADLVLRAVKALAEPS